MCVSSWVDGPGHTPVTHTRRTANALGDINESSASVCVHEFCQDMTRASEFMTNLQRVINKSGAYKSANIQCFAKAQSHKVDARRTHLKLFIFC